MLYRPLRQPSSFLQANYQPLNKEYNYVTNMPNPY